jgi:hypothetical protein
LTVASRYDPLPTGGGAGLVRRGSVVGRGSIVEDVLARPLGFAPLLSVSLPRDTDQHEAGLIDVRVGEAVDAVLTHALGELARDLELGTVGRGELGDRCGGGRASVVVVGLAVVDVAASLPSEPPSLLQAASIATRAKAANATVSGRLVRGALGG